jgi:hypothetical protein
MESIGVSIGETRENKEGFIAGLKEKVDSLTGYPNLYLRALIEGRAKTLDHAGVLKIVEDNYQKYRKVDISGEDNLPNEGGFIIVPNHFARADDKETMEGSLKMTDMFLGMSMINKVVRERTTAKRVLWPEAFTPRPHDPMPENITPKSFVEWVFNQAKYASANLLRVMYFKAFSYAEDIVSVPHDFKFSQLKAVFTRSAGELKLGNVLAIYPEGEVTHALNEGAKTGRNEPVKFHGASHFATQFQRKIVPVAVWDEKGTLKMVIGKPVEPPAGDSDAERKALTEQVFLEIAKLMPPDLRGQYYGSKLEQMEQGVQTV